MTISLNDKPVPSNERKVNKESIHIHNQQNQTSHWRLASILSIVITSEPKAHLSQKSFFKKTQNLLRKIWQIFLTFLNYRFTTYCKHAQGLILFTFHTKKLIFIYVFFGNFHLGILDLISPKTHQMSPVTVCHKTHQYISYSFTTAWHMVWCNSITL